ncbi:MAG: multidrug ABC transporter ATP-binding protein [Alphaproteobacteria bacterium]|nr:MAG: multidrug ABC transporter ATP-binding protein [Alphaproteobacteria bacterium]
MTKPAISVQSLTKTYDSGLIALDDINLDIAQGEIFALLGPNGAGKTTLISAICGIIRVSDGIIEICGHDHTKEYRIARGKIGLVPQELTTDAFETVWNTVSFSRGLFGKPKNPAFIEEILKDLSLWDKKDEQIRKLSGGMKRRVMIAKALSHEPEILFLDEPSAGVDVELRKSMWRQIRRLRDNGTTIILTTHYIEEAEEMADRIGIINKGKLILIEEKKTLMKKLGKKELILELYSKVTEIPTPLADYNLLLSENGKRLTFTYDPSKKNNGVAELLDHLKDSGIKCKDIDTRQSSLEDIFVTLVGQS